MKRTEGVLLGGAGIGLMIGAIYAALFPGGGVRLPGWSEGLLLVPATVVATWAIDRLGPRLSPRGPRWRAGRGWSLVPQALWAGAWLAALAGASFGLLVGTVLAGPELLSAASPAEAAERLLTLPLTLALFASSGFVMGLSVGAVFGLVPVGGALFLGLVHILDRPRDRLTA